MGKATRMQRRLQSKNEAKELKNPKLTEQEIKRRNLSFGISYLMFGLFSSIVVYNLVLLAYNYPDYIGFTIQESEVLPLQIIGVLSGVLIGANGYFKEVKNKNLLELLKIQK
jgi:hypothetical protein